jgi:hypothetical protein
MVRLMYLTLAVAVAISISTASAQTNGKARSNVQSTAGVVKAVAASSLTIERGGNELTFGVDSSTRFLASGSKVGDLVYRERRFTDAVKAGDHVTVRYRQANGAMNAVEVRVVQE